MRKCPVPAVLGAIINASGAAAVIKDDEPIPASRCITYLSTYLAPLLTRPVDPASSEASRGRVDPSLVQSFYWNSSSVTSSSENQFSVTATLEDPASLVSSGASSTEEQQSSDSSITFLPVPSISSGALPPTDVVSSDPASATSASLNPGDRSIIFQVVPSTDPEKRDLSRRALGGFIGSPSAANPDACTDATEFSLISGQLLDNGVPLYYDGEEFKLLSGQGQPPDDAVTTGFQNVGGSLRFINSSLPNGEAFFCQDSAAGQVYITFSDLPDGCRPVLIAVYTDMLPCSRVSEVST